MITKTIIKTKAIFKDGVFRPLDDVMLSESQVVELTILSLYDGSWETLTWTENDEPAQETLADVLGFDPDDEEKSRELAESQHRAIQRIIGIATTDETDDASEQHDEFLYGRSAP